MSRRLEVHLLAEQLDVTFVGAIEPGQDVREGRLAGTVLPEQRVHLPNGGFEVDRIVGQNPWEALGDTDHAHGGDLRGAGCPGASRDRFTSGDRLPHV